MVGKVTLHTIPRLPDAALRPLAGRPVTIDGNTLDVRLQFMLNSSKLAGKEGLILSENVAVARRELNAVAAQFPRMKVDVTSTELAVPGPAGDIPALLLRRRNDRGTAAPLLIYYHGGGFVVGGWETHGNLCELLCHDGGVPVLFVDYRLAPEHKAPAALDDAYAAFRWATEHAAELGADASRIAVGGDSAGANLAAGVALRARDEGVGAPALQLLLYPVTNMASHTRSYGLFSEGFFLRRWDMDFCNDKYLSGSGVEPTDPRVSPLLADDFARLPPAIVVTAGFDPLRDEGRQFADALAAAGNVVDAREYGSMIHSFPNFASLGGGPMKATADFISAMRAHLSRS
ncbi:lipase [Mycolicibacterium agri]|uniref:Lipase n=1 Tax=Mycolicibacterium agri TaxID=36811 RepID=A0A2A7NE34_MYCAG|nr:lipase [Mycolicibacterium agri]GFG49852.1 lipase [Mycolicibacterium agri]